MKITKKSNGKVYNAEHNGNVMRDEGGKWTTDDPEFPVRNGQQLHETYLMGEVRVVQPKPKAAVPAPTPPTVVAPNFAKSDTDVLPKIEVPKKVEEPVFERKVELPKPKAKKKGRGRFGKGHRADKSSERSGDTV